MMIPLRMLLLGGLLVAGSMAAYAQGGRPGGHGPGSGGPSGHSGGMGMPGGGIGMPGSRMPAGNGTVPHDSVPVRSGPGSPTSSGTAASTSRSGLQVGPPGRWWDDKQYASTLGIDRDQQKRMDSVFGHHRDALTSRYETLRKAQANLEKLTHADHPDQGALFSGIDRVAQARADLEKANTSMLLGIRSELTPEQIDRLDQLR